MYLSGYNFHIIMYCALRNHTINGRHVVTSLYIMDTVNNAQDLYPSPYPLYFSLSTDTNPRSEPCSCGSHFSSSTSPLPSSSASSSFLA